jgi:hypothetical protein
MMVDHREIVEKPSVRNGFFCIMARDKEAEIRRPDGQKWLPIHGVRKG